MTPTQLSLRSLRETGYHAAVVEHWNPFAHIRQDLFQWIDIVSVHPKLAGVLGVQTTSLKNVGARVKKARSNEALLAWLSCGGRLEVHGWHKVSNRWQVEVTQIRKEDVV